MADISTADRPTSPRLAPLDPAALAADQRAIASVGASNVLLTLARRPDLLTSWLAWGASFTSQGRLTPRLRELAILRVGLRTRCAYEWANHVAGALGVGVSSSEIAALAAGGGDWGASERAVLQAVDDLCRDDCVSDATWRTLQEVFDDGTVIELVLLVGFYRQNAGLLNSLGVQPEPGRPSLGETIEYAAPTSAAPAPVDETAHVRADGNWTVHFRHPAGTQDLDVSLRTNGEVVTGTVGNPAAGVEVRLSDGLLRGNHLTCTTDVTVPFTATIRWDGVISGDTIGGTVEVKGAGTYPFDGRRATE